MQFPSQRPTSSDHKFLPLLCPALQEVEENHLEGDDRPIMMQRMLRSVDRKAQRILPTAMVRGIRPLWTMDAKKLEAPVGFLDVRGFPKTRQVKDASCNQPLSLETWNRVHLPGLGRLGQNLVSAHHAAENCTPPPLCRTPPCPTFSFRLSLSGPKPAPGYLKVT